MTPPFSLVLSHITYRLLLVLLGLVAFPVLVIQLTAHPLVEPAPLTAPLPEISASAAEMQEHFTNLVGYDTRSLTLLANGRAVQVSFVGALDSALELLPETSLYGERVTYPALWQGIGLMVLNAEQGGVTGLLEVSPLANPGQVQMKLSTALQVQFDGSLTADQPGGTFTVSAPRAWQTIDETVQAVTAGYVVTPVQGGSLLAVELGTYDPSYPLVIEVAFGE